MPSPRVITFWLARLDSGYYAPRRDACRLLGKSGDLRAVAPLIARLGDSITSVQVAAALALGELGDARAVEPLLALLGNRNRDVRGAAAQAIGRLRDMRAFAPLLALLNDRSWLVRAGACEGLGYLGNAEAVESILPALQSSVGPERRAACVGLGLLRDARAVEPLLARLPQERLYHQVRMALYLALGRIRDPRAYETLMSRLSVESQKARDTVFTALGELGDSRAVLPILERFRFDPGRLPPAARAVLRQLGQGPLLDALDLLLRRGDTEPLLALGGKADALAVPVLLRWTTRADARLRRAACRILGELGAAQAIPQLAACLNDDLPAVRQAACTALGQVGTAREATKVAARMGDTVPAVRAAALTALDRLDQDMLAPAIRAMLDGDPAALAELLLAEEHPVTRPLISLLMATRTDLPLLRALLRLFNDIWEAQAAGTPRMLCRPCLLRPTPREYRKFLIGGTRILTCRGCGAVLHFKREITEVVAVLDSRETKVVTMRKGVARVYWPQREALFDFDRVEILAASDYDVERFCVSAGNDMDRTRTARYRTLPVTVAAECRLSENTLRVLGHIFGTVTGKSA
jgi:HEAT repeat protein